VKETTTFGVPYNPEVEITKRIDHHAGGDKKFSLLVCEDTKYHTLQSGSGVFKKKKSGSGKHISTLYWCTCA
jgi:hypothetical protein